MSFADLIQVGAVHARPIRVLIHSEPKVGKSHLAAGADHPIFFDAEQGSKGFDVARVDLRDWRDLEKGLDFLTWQPHDFGTVVFDTLDSLERVAAANVLSGSKCDSLMDMPYGKGWSGMEERWRWLAERLSKLQEERGMSVIFLAHCQPKGHQEPDGAAWNRWELRVNVKTSGVFLGWVEEIFFLQAKVGTKHKSKIGQSMTRVLHTQQSPAFQAGSRRIKDSQIQIPVAEPAQCWEKVREAYRRGAGSPARQARPPQGGQPSPAPSPAPAPAPKPGVYTGEELHSALGTIWPEGLPITQAGQAEARTRFDAIARKGSATRDELNALEAWIQSVTKPDPQPAPASSPSSGQTSTAPQGPTPKPEQSTAFPIEEPEGAPVGDPA